MRVEFQFVLAALAVWRLTHLFSAEDGPWRIFARLRGLVRRGFWAELLGCFYCLSLWVAAPFAWWLGNAWTARLLFWLALSAAAILLDRATGQFVPHYTEDPEEREQAEKGHAP